MITTKSHIAITGAAGFIGAAFASFLNEKGYEQLILIDDFTVEKKKINHQNINCIRKIQRNDFEFALSQDIKIDIIIHLGARTDTGEMNTAIFDKLNVAYTQMLWQYCTRNNLPFIYASSAATYGNGDLGYSDDHSIIPLLKPLNPYAVSKQQVDEWILSQKETPTNWYGFKFFNVYGYPEMHKGRMASVVWHAYHQIKNEKKIKLFRSHKEGYADGEQKRDFIYVRDLCKVLYWTMLNRPTSGIYNLGTGEAATFNNLALSLFNTLHLKPCIEYIDTPQDIRQAYQYFTQADMRKLKNEGYVDSFLSISQGIDEYVNQYLISM